MVNLSTRMTGAIGSLIAAVLLSGWSMLFVIAPDAQETKPASKQDITVANPADVESLDAIMTAIYDVISGPKGQERDWDRFRSLFVDGARLIPQSNQAGAIVLSPEDYVNRSGSFLVDNGFFEIEIGRRVERYGNIAHVFSAYEARNALEDEAPFLRGINSFQLLYHNNRWWVVTIYWQQETEDNPIPDDMIQ